MPTYTVTDTKLQDLNVLINEGGQIPSAVSDALAGVQSALAAGNTAGASKALDVAIKANIKSGKAWADVQAWHDSVKAGGGEGTDPGPPIGSIQPYPGNGALLYQGVIYAQTGSGLKRCSWTIGSGGYQCFGSYDSADMGGGYSGGTPFINSPDGDWTYYMRFDADPGRKQQGTLTIYPA